MNNVLDKLCIEMIDYNRRDPKRVQHTIKVHSFASLIGHSERLDDRTQFIVEAAALVHDLDKRRKDSTGKKPQQGSEPAETELLLKRLGLEEADIDRITDLVGSHHANAEIDGIDGQILAEADYLVKIYEDRMSQRILKSTYDRIFRTEAGKKIYREMYLDDRGNEYKEWMANK
jgi:HD superfamily phosphodiesterase